MSAPSTSNLAGDETPSALPPVNPATEPLSPWWIRTILIVLVVGAVVLIAITAMGYKKAPPVPGQTVDAQGQVLFTGDEVRAGQGVFLKYGLMNNGSIWGHGAYLGPDVAPHRCGHCRSAGARTIRAAGVGVERRTDGRGARADCRAAQDQPLRR